MIGRISLLVLLALALGCAPAGAWNLVQVGPHERSIEIQYDSGACETSVVHDVQSKNAISVAVEHNPIGDGPCILIAYSTIVKIRLSRPLAGRHIQGGDRPYVFDGPYQARNGNRFPVVPRLVGLAPSDAKFLLGGLRLRGAFSAVGRLRRRPRVVAQSPAAGVRDPKNKLVRVMLG